MAEVNIDARLKEAADNLEALSKQHAMNEKKFQQLQKEQGQIENRIVYWQGRADAMRAFIQDATEPGPAEQLSAGELLDALTAEEVDAPPPLVPQE